MSPKTEAQHRMMKRRHYCTIMLSVAQEDHQVIIEDNEVYASIEATYHDLNTANQVYDDVIKKFHELRDFLIERKFHDYKEDISDRKCVDE